MLFYEKSLEKFKILLVTSKQSFTTFTTFMISVSQS